MRNHEKFHPPYKRFIEKRFLKHADAKACSDDMCDGKRMHERFRRYHRFFMIGPFLWFSLTAYIVFRSVTAPELGWDWHKVLMYILLLILVKETLSFSVSKRMYHRILKPVESLRDGMEEVAHGNYNHVVETSGGLEIRTLIHAFNKMAHELKVSDELKQKYELNRKELIANISHDLKTPITSINGYVDGIVDGVANSPEKTQRYMTIIQQNAKYMNRLIDDLMLYSKLDVQKIDFHFQPILFREYVEDLYNEIRLELEEQGCRMHLAIDLASDRVFMIDGQHLTRAIRNIVSNALKYNEKDVVEIGFELTFESEKAVLCIHDNGPGIPQDKLDQIFDRFFRGDDARSSTIGGSGLGLAIAKEIVSAHKGHITARSRLGEGTTICIVLPQSQSIEPKKEIQ